MGRNKSIDYNLGNYSQPPLAESGHGVTSCFQHSFLLKWKLAMVINGMAFSNRLLDYFLEGVLLDTIRDYNPDFVTAHFLQLDSMRPATELIRSKPSKPLSTLMVA